jgi:glycosyltransferase involved in cell wall biosynthesis
MVCTFHDLFVLTGDYSTPEFRARFAGQARIAADRADRIIAVSQFTAMQIQHLLGVEIDRLRVVPHGVLQPNPPVGVEREKLVLHVGAVQVRKNIARLVDAFQEMPTDWRFVLAGSSGYGAEEIAKKIEGSPARDRIELRGYVPLLELENLYARASIFAFPSLDEGFGMPVLDAMARGVPVLTSNRSALPEVAGGAALLVDPLDRDEIAAALLRLASDERLRTRLTEEGYTRAALFSWTASVEKTAAVYRELLET